MDTGIITSSRPAVYPQIPAVQANRRTNITAAVQDEAAISPGGQAGGRRRGHRGPLRRRNGHGLPLLRRGVPQGHTGLFQYYQGPLRQ